MNYTAGNANFNPGNSWSSNFFGGTGSGDENGGGGKKGKNIIWKPLDIVTMEFLQATNKTNSLAARCRSYIIDHIFQNEFQVYTREGKAVDFDYNFKKFFNERYKRFAIDALDCILTIGIIPVCLVEHSSGDFYPAVPAEGTYAIEVGYVIDTERRYYRILRPKELYFNESAKLKRVSMAQNGVSMLLGNLINQMRQQFPGGSKCGPGGADSAISGTGGDTYGLSGCGPVVATEAFSSWFLDESVHIIDGLGYDPHIIRGIQSPLRSMMGDFQFINTLAENLLVGEIRLTDPIYKMQHHKDAQKSDADGLKANLAYTDAEEFDVENAKKIEYTKQQRLALAEQMQATRRALASKATFGAISGAGCTSGGCGGGLGGSSITAASTGVIGGGDPNTIASGYGYGQFIVPEGLEYVSGEVPEKYTGRYYHDLRLLFDDNLTSTYGIPIALVRQIGQHLRGNQQEQANIWRQSLQKYAKLIGEILTIAINEAYADDEDRLNGHIFGFKPVSDEARFNRIPEDGMESADLYVLEDQTEKMTFTSDIRDHIVQISGDDLGGGNSSTGGAAAFKKSSGGKEDDGVIRDEKEISKEVADLKEIAKEKVKEDKKRKKDEAASEADESSEEKKPNKRAKKSGSGKSTEGAKITDLRKRKSEYYAKTTADNTSGAEKKPMEEKDKLVVVVDVSNFMDVKLGKHGLDIGAIPLSAYQRTIRNRCHFPDIALNNFKNNETSNKIVEMMVRDFGSDPPREDLMEPDSENLAKNLRKVAKNRRIAPGLLIDIAKRGGDMQQINTDVQKAYAAENKRKEAAKKEKEKTAGAASSSSNSAAKTKKEK